MTASTAPSPIVLTESDLRQLCPIDIEALTAIEDSFRWLAEGRVEMPPIMHITVADQGGIDVKGAYVRGLDNFAIKIGSGFFGNPHLGLPSSSAVSIVLDARTGLCEAVLLDNGYLTDLRTGLAGAVAAAHLAPSVVDCVGVIGAGVQARIQLECLGLVRDISQVRLWSRSPQRSLSLARDLEDRLGLKVTVCIEPETVVRESQLLITTTPSEQPVVMGDWLHPGTHVTTVGSDTPAKQELRSDCFGSARLVVCDSIAQCALQGELRHAVASGALPASTPVWELGQIVSGEHRYERRAEDITICDLTGLGSQDTAIGRLAVARYARASG